MSDTVCSLHAEQLEFGYRSEPLIENFNLSVMKGEWLGIVGPNGSGKSTVLRMMARLLSPRQGSILLDGKDIAQMSTKKVARQLSMLAQTQEATLDLTVRELVRRGRNPHLKWYEECRGSHEEIVDWALEATDTTKLQDRSLLTLSGGERQRAWLAMAVAQTPETLLLDEPTTYLDLAHQLELMELIRHLNKEQGITVVMVLHDLNQAARYCDRLAAMKDGVLLHEGAPKELFAPDFFRQVFGIEAKVHDDDGVPVCLPCSVSRQRPGQVAVAAI